MPHPDLTDVVREIRKFIALKNSDTNTLRLLVRDGCRLLDRKFPNPDPRSNIGIWIHSFRSNIENPVGQNIVALLTNRNFANLLRRKVETTYNTKLQTREIYSPELGEFMDCVRLKDRLLIENPYIALNSRPGEFSIQSWARPKSKSKEYNRHLKESKNSKKSKFSVSLDMVEQIEFELFNHGYGLMINEGRIFFYGKISKNIGHLPNQGQHVPYVRLQCDRVPRPTGKGTRVEIHGYPISSAEIVSDFAKYPVNIIPKINDRQFYIG